MDLPRSSPIVEATSHLTHGHEQIERMVAEILATPVSYAKELRAMWLPFAALLVAHLDEEDHHLNPVLARMTEIGEREVRGLLLEHRYLRMRVSELDAIHARGGLDSALLRGFASEVLAHQRREHVLLDRLAEV